MIDRIKEVPMPSFIDDRIIDRLVDDELSPTERRAVIDQLEADPASWRKVGLAFLEAQAWKRGADALLIAPRSRPENATDSVPIKAPALSRGRLWAAIFIPIAFVLGYVTPRSGDRLTPFKDVTTEQNQTQGKPSSEPSVPAIVGGADLAANLDGRPVVRVPLVPSQSLDPDWGKAPAELVPEYVRLQWERRGYAVEEHRSLLPVPLADGRKAVVPVENVRVKYVGQTIY
jgi:hypothetical protein